MLLDELDRLPAELARVDALLDDPAFFARSRRTSAHGWSTPSTPMER
jgi:hypothetical protein